MIVMAYLNMFFTVITFIMYSIYIIKKKKIAKTIKYINLNECVYLSRLILKKIAITIQRM